MILCFSEFEVVWRPGSGMEMENLQVMSIFMGLVKLLSSLLRTEKRTL